MGRFRFILLAVLLAIATLVAAFGMVQAMDGMSGHDVACVSDCISQLLDDAPSAAPILLVFTAILAAFVVVSIRADAPAFRLALTPVHLDRRRIPLVARRE